MPALVWPVGLPQWPLSGFRVAPLDTRVISQMETGTRKMRQSCTRPPRLYQCELVLTGTEKATFESFFAQTQYGVLPFEWYDPDCDVSSPTTVSMTFEGMPERDLINGGATIAEERWSLKMQLRIIVE